MEDIKDCSNLVAILILLELTLQFIIETVEMKLNQLSDENEQLKKRNEFLKKRCDEYWEEAGLNNDYFE